MFARVLGAAFLLLPGLVPPASGAPVRASLDERIRGRWSAATFAQVSLELPQGLPETISVEVERDGRMLVLDLERYSVRAPGFRLRSFADGLTTLVPPPPATTYRGRVRGEEITVAGSLGRDGLSVRAFPKEGMGWTLRPVAIIELGASRADHVLIEGGDWPAGRDCGASDAPPFAMDASGQAAPAGGGLGDSAQRRRPGLPGGSERPSPAWCGGTGMKLAQIAFDVDQEYYRDHGSDLAAVLANVEGLLAEVDAYYARDALITYEITDIIVRTTDFYLPDATTGSLLGLFRDEWNANQTAVVRDIAHLMTGQPAPGLAGLAYVGVTCNLAWCYGWSVDSAGVVGHELGHNWNAGHCHDTAPCNNMCGACLFIGPNTKDIIMAFRDTRGCLDDVPAYGAAVPPYAHPDEFVLGRDVAVSRSPVSLDVLANDHDANCNDIRIASFDAVSRRGGRISLEAGTGPAGRDVLILEPPCMLFAGADEFAYQIADDAGGNATATVRVDIDDPGLLGAWPLDEGAGAVASDATGWARDGGIAGAAWIPGVTGSALDLDGTSSSVIIPPLELQRLPVTITGWMRRSGPLQPFSGLVFCRGGSTVAGLHAGNANELRYTWSDDPATYGRSSGLVLPDGEWAFVALVVEEGRAIIGMHDGATWQTWENVLAHDVQRFDADVHLGWDPTDPARRFRGGIDDVRVFQAALTDAELLALRTGSSKASAPRPADGSFESDPGVLLSWLASPSASSHDVYFGTDYAAVSHATPASPEFAGNVAGASFVPQGLLVEGFTYAWRVDGIVAGVPVRGDTWLFTFEGRTPRLLHYWKLDEGAGTSAADGVTGVAAELRNGAAWGAGRLGGAIVLDGTNDLVAAPLPGTPLTEATITAWIRSTGMPATRAGFVFTRGGGASGLGVSNAAELSYHWADGHWGWSSGLTLPLDTWVFVALAVRPDSATIFMNPDDGSGWQQATNVANHAQVPWTGELAIGRDPWGAARSFAGAIDDVRILDRALELAELQRIFAEPSRAMNPAPADGAALLAPPLEFSWVAGADAVTHDLFVGSDLAAVRAALPGAPEFRGNLAETSWTPAADLLAAGGTWYWRVDERLGAAVATGDTWRFLVLGGVGDSLRVRKSAAGRPVLSWGREQSSEAFEILRCAPALAGDCPRSLTDEVPGSVLDWEDPAASEPLVWYEVRSRPCVP